MSYKTINIDIFGIGKKADNTIAFIIILVILIIALLLYILAGIGSILFPGITEMNGDIVEGHSGRLIAYILIVLAGCFFIFALFINRSKLIAWVAYLVLVGIVGYIIDPAVSRGYDLYVQTSNGKYRIFNAHLMKQGTHWNIYDWSRIDGFDLVYGPKTHRVVLGKIAWINIHKQESIREENVL